MGFLLHSCLLYTSALLNGNTRNEEFADFADDKGFTYVPSYFDTTAEMEEALQSGKVDAIVRCV